MTTHATSYPYLTSLNTGALEEQYAAFKNALIKHAPQLSPVRAGELAAAYLFDLLADEWGYLFREVQEAREESDETRLYERLIDKSFAEPLVDLSGTRTLFADRDYIEYVSTKLGITFYDALLRIAASGKTAEEWLQELAKGEVKHD